MSLPIPLISIYCIFFQHFSILLPTDLCSFLHTKGIILYFPCFKLTFSLNIVWIFSISVDFHLSSSFLVLQSVSLYKCSIISLTSPLWANIYYYVFMAYLQVFCYYIDAFANTLKSNNFNRCGSYIWQLWCLFSQSRANSSTNTHDNF